VDVNAELDFFCLLSGLVSFLFPLDEYMNLLLQEIQELEVFFLSDCLYLGTASVFCRSVFLMFLTLT